MECIYPPDVSAILHTSLPLMFMFCRYKSTVQKLITVHTVKLLPLYFIKYSLYLKTFKVKVVTLRGFICYVIYQFFVC